MVLGLVLAAVTAVAGNSVFMDAAGCAAAAKRGEHMTRAHDVLRIVNWNVRWFPDGGPGKTAGTNLEWLACALVWLDADIVVLEEMKRSPSAIAAMESVLAQLGAGGRWQVIFDDCPHPESQHLGMLYRTDRVELSHVVTRGEIDPTTVKNGTPSCPGRLRPALTAYVRSKRGGLDFHLAGVHLDSGKESRDQDDRRAAWQRLAPLTQGMLAAFADDDLMVIGDFNTMGCKGCGLVTPAEELAGMTQAMLAQGLPYRVASRELACSEYYHEHGSLLDHVLIAATMQEADDALVRISGICADLACKKLDAAHLPAMTELSDHCPVVIDIPDKDIDGR
jgi:endonuclease/exonuclease/phosphatase family metal-dependent hydrolase